MSNNKRFLKELQNLKLRSIEGDHGFLVPNVDLKKDEEKDFYSLVIYIQPFPECEGFVEGKYLEVLFKIPSKWPTEAIDIYFKTALSHPNISPESNDLGYRVCHDVCSCNNTNNNLYAIIRAICELLGQPNPHSPLNDSSAALYYESQTIFFEQMKKHFTDFGKTESEMYQLGEKRQVVDLCDSDEDKSTKKSKV